MNTPSIAIPCGMLGRVDDCRFATGGVIYYGLSLSTSSLGGDKYINFFLSGAVEAPAYALTVVVLQKSVPSLKRFTFSSIHFYTRTYIIV